MTSVCRARPRLLIGFVSFLVGLSAGPFSSWGSLPAEREPRPQPIAPAAGAKVSEAGLRFAWTPPPGTSQHLLLVSRTPFDTRGWSRAPEVTAIRVYRLEHPIASLEQTDIKLERDTQLYWAVASQDQASGRFFFSGTQSCFVQRKFTNRIESTPFLSASPVRPITVQTPKAAGRIRLASGHTIDPRHGEPPLPASLREAEGPSAAVRTFLIYYGDADPEKTRSSILESGGTIVGYIPDHTFLVRMKSTSQFSLDNAAGWVGAYQPGYKLSPRLNLESNTTRPITVLLFADGDLSAVRSAAQSGGGQVTASSDNGINKILRISVPGSAVASLAQHPDVAWIEPYLRQELHNSDVQWVVQTSGNGARRIWDMGIHGEGQVVMTSDSGVETNHYQFYDPAVPITTFGDYPTHRKVIAYRLGSLNPNVAFGDQASTFYHGSHTACTAVGSDDPISTDLRDGVAKGAKLFFEDLSGPALGTSLDPFPDLNDLFLPSYIGNAGGAARIASNSWGASAAGAYTVESLNIDQFMWSHPDYLIFFSNGNSGPGFGSVGTPATAKSSVGAGAVRNGTSSDQYAAFTSRGPTADGRIKPTLCAPGQLVYSANQAPNTYIGLTGTSMACPAMAGCAALIRQYCTDGWYPTGTKVPGNGFAPSAALLKAMCVNSGNNQITGFQAPDDNVGFGRINADSVLYFAGDQRRLLLVDYTPGLGHHQSIEYQVNVTDGTIPLKVALCWTDYPGDPMASKQLRNNLDLTVAHGVTTYDGNNFANGLSVTGEFHDVTNVEEEVRVGTPAPGLWTIHIDATDVPFGPQPFGLCITGGIGTNAGTIALDRASYGSASTVELQVTDTNAGPSVNVTVSSMTEPAGETLTLTGANGLYSGTFHLSPFTGTAGDGVLQVSHGDLISATYHDASPAAALTATALVSFTPPLITDVAGFSQGNGSALVLWKTDESASSKVYYGSTPSLGSETTPDPLVQIDHQVLVTGLNPGQTYYYDVESQDLNGSVTRDDNGGAHYRVTVGPPAQFLLIYNGGLFERPERYITALRDLGWSYDLWKGPLSETPQLGDLNGGLRAYLAVWWEAGLETYPPFSDAARDALTQYLDGGGRLVVTGHDIAWAFANTSSPYYTPDRQTWLANTLRTFFNDDRPAWTGLKGLAGSPISSNYTGGIPYAEHRAGASGDEVTPHAVGGPTFNDWMSVESAPDVCGFHWESGGPLGSPGTAFWGGTVSRLASMNFAWSSIDPNATTSALRDSVMDKTLQWLLGRAKPTVALVTPNGGTPVTADKVSIVWTETSASGTSIASRTLEYSPDGGESWNLIASTVGPSPYSWDLSTVQNTPRALVRVRVRDNGTPAFPAADVNAEFPIQRAHGDAVGPTVIAGSIRVTPNPVDNQRPASLSATITDANTGGATVVQAEWSFGNAAASPGHGFAMYGSFDSPTTDVSESISTRILTPGPGKFWVRGRDQAGNWGPASALAVIVNGNTVPLSATMIPRAFELKQNAPNPVLDETAISFAVPVESRVSLAIFDPQGRQLRGLVDRTIVPGFHTVRWDRTDDGGRRVPPGVYYYRFTASGRTYLRKLVALR